MPSHTTVVEIINTTRKANGLVWSQAKLDSVIHDATKNGEVYVACNHRAIEIIADAMGFKMNDDWV